MKTYRIYLKSGATFVIEANTFDIRGVDGVAFFTQSDRPDKEIFVRTTEVAAIFPEENKEPTLPGTGVY